MNNLDRLLGYFAPVWALKRQGARLGLNVLGKGSKKRSFDALSNNRLRKDWVNSTMDADTSNAGSLEGLRNNVRKLERETGIVAGPIKRISNNVVGRGIIPQSRVKEDGKYDNSDPKIAITKDTAERFNYQAEKNWKIWINKADATLVQSFYEQQRLAHRTMLRDGEVLAVCRSSEKYNRIIPLCVELIEIDRLTTPYSEVKNPKIRNGIGFDDEGVPNKYYVLKQHPGSNIYTAQKDDAFETIDAFDKNGMRKVMHLYDILRPGQSRGYSAFASGLKDLQDLDRYIEAEGVAARINACLAAFIKTPSAYSMQQSLTPNSDSQRIDEFEPGMIEYLNPGEEVEVFQSKRPNSQFREFIKQMVSNVANATDVPYEIFSMDWRDHNYSSARTILLQAYLAFRIYQAYMIFHFCAPVWENFISDCIVGGLVEAPNFKERRNDYLKVSWIPPGWSWVDPLKESKSAETELNESISTLADIMAAKGDDWEEKLEQRAQELKRIKELEKKYDIEFPKKEKATVNDGNGNNSDNSKE